MKTRAITGFFFIIVMLASMLLGHWVFGGFYLVLSVLCLREFYGLVEQAGMSPNQRAGIPISVFVYIAFAIFVAGAQPENAKFYLILSACLFIAPFTQQLFIRSSTPFTDIAYTFLGLVLIIVPFTFFHALAYLQGDFNFHFPLAFFLMLWSNDTGAYLTGRAFGKHKLFERHSPKKTWEGFIGGVFIAAGVGVIIGQFYTEITWMQWGGMGIIIGVIGTMGDLVESMFKRSINVKDSGSILPGHGGLLDRFDGLFLAVPVVYAYLYFITN